MNAAAGYLLPARAHAARAFAQIASHQEGCRHSTACDPHSGQFRKWERPSMRMSPKGGVVCFQPQRMQWKVQRCIGPHTAPTP
jgi:hypothetical protein